MQGPKCPVCGMDVTNSQITTIYRGKQFKFCSLECKQKFDASPERYA